MNVDQNKLEASMGKMIGHMTGGTICYSICLGDDLGLYRAMAGAGPLKADAVAAKTKCHPRLVREWLDGQAASRLISYDAKGDSYELGPQAGNGARRRCFTGVRRARDERVWFDVLRYGESRKGLPR